MKIIANLKLAGISALLVGSMVACGAAQKPGEGGQVKASEATMAAIAEAKAEIEKAKANKWLWRDTEEFVKKAEEAAGKGEEETAIKLANKAKTEAMLAQKQFELEQNQDRSKYVQ